MGGRWGWVGGWGNDRELLGGDGPDSEEMLRGEGDLEEEILRGFVYGLDWGSVRGKGGKVVEEGVGRGGEGRWGDGRI